MKTIETRFLLDLNALIYLVNPDCKQYPAMLEWFDSFGHNNWGVCPLTEAGFVRVTTNPAYNGPDRTVAQAMAILADLAIRPGYRYWPISDSLLTLSAFFCSRITGHQQITDSYLLGLAIKNNGVLVTFDKALRHLAGTEYSRNLLILT